MENGRIADELGASRILVVDDERSNVDVLERLLRRQGYTDVRSTTDPREAVGLFRESEPDLLILDLRMPHMDGFEVMEHVGDALDPEHRIPILVLTAETEPAVRRRALAAGARDFVTKPFEVTEVLLRIRNLLEMRHLHRRISRHAEELEETVEKRTKELAETRLEVLQRLAIAAEYRDDVTGKHAERVGVLSAWVAESLGLGADEVELIRRAAPLHDVGKIGIPDTILLKPGPLTTEEFDVMKSHVTIGARILGGSDYPLLRMARRIALTHHERWDGAGYLGMAAEDIPMVGRIVAVADAFDTLTHERPYKPALDRISAAARIARDTGTHFDPRTAGAFRDVFRSGKADALDDVAREALAAGDGSGSRQGQGRRPDPVRDRH